MPEKVDCYGKEGCCKECDMDKRNAHRTTEDDPTHPGLKKCKCKEWICSQCIYRREDEKGCKLSKKHPYVKK